MVPSTLNQKLDSPKSGHGGSPEQSFTQAFHCKVWVTVQTGFHKGGRIN